jgi:hypothetical protein
MELRRQSGPSSADPNAEKFKDVKLLHSHLVIKNPMIRSAQSQVYSVYDQHGEPLVLKTFPPKEWHQQAYRGEKEILYKLRSLNLAKFGFPRVISYKDGPEGSEILMEQLGVSLNAESFQNRKRFTKEHAYDITL